MSEEIFELTDQEIGEAIVEWIGKYRRGMGFFPYHIKRTEMVITPTVQFYLGYVPKGSIVGEYPHRFRLIEMD
jgi:hypothetical protein